MRKLSLKGVPDAVYPHVGRTYRTRGGQTAIVLRQYDVPGLAVMFCGKVTDGNRSRKCQWLGTGHHFIWGDALDLVEEVA